MKLYSWWNGHLIWWQAIVDTCKQRNCLIIHGNGFSFLFLRLSSAIHKCIMSIRVNILMDDCHLSNITKLEKKKHIQIFEIYFILKHRFQIPCTDESCCACVHFSFMGNIEITTWRIRLVMKKFYNFIISFVLTMKLLPNWYFEIWIKIWNICLY